MSDSFSRLKAACYTTNITMAVIACLPPLLFLTFRNLYGISYSLLGMLVLINFCTQLIIDLIFSFFSHKFNISLTVKLMPFLSILGLVIYGLTPYIFPSAIFPGLLLGTIIFSASSGLAEVLISPIIASIPSKEPDREMSKLHSIYAWGSVGVVIFITLFLLIFKSERWQVLPFILLFIPLTSGILFWGSKIPEMEASEKSSGGAIDFLKSKKAWFCIAAIFLGGAAECTMSQWASSYLEETFRINKMLGDVFGVALFAFALGMGRTLFSKIGKNAAKAIFWGALGATVCYLLAALSPFPLIGLLGCAFTGFCVSMMWPGSLIVSTDIFPNAGVLIYAFMAAGGDLGASVGPQLVGIITDAAIQSNFFNDLAVTFGLSSEQIGMRLGILFGAIFPICAIPVYATFMEKNKNK